MATPPTFERDQHDPPVPRPLTQPKRSPATAVVIVGLVLLAVVLVVLL
jgi:hypothetical protein